MFEGLGHDQSMMRRHHSLLLFNLIRDARQISRVDLAKASQMSGTSVGKIVKELMDYGLVIETGQTSGKVGRKPTLLQINPQGALVIGVDIDIDRITLGVVDLNGKVISRRDQAIDMEQDDEAVLDGIADRILELIASNGSSNIIGVGVCIPGLVSWPDGNVAAVPQFHWKNVKVREHLEEKLNLTVYVDNNVKTSLLAEYLFGSVKGLKHVVGIHIGSGLGSAVIENGEILRGVGNTLGEIGHILMDPTGQLCDCGRFGCLQTFICSTALEKQAGKPIAEIVAAANDNDPAAVRLMDRAGEYLAIAIANAICLYNPESVLLVGAMTEYYPQIVSKVEECLPKYAWEPLSRSFSLRSPQLGSDSGIIGGTALVLNEQLKSPLHKFNGFEDNNILPLDLN